MILTYLAPVTYHNPATYLSILPVVVNSRYVISRKALGTIVAMQDGRYRVRLAGMKH